MKKALVLVAGLFLATGTIFAEGKIDFSGSSIRYQQLIKNSEWSNTLQNDSNWGTDAVLKLNYKIDEKNSLNLSYSTDDDDEFDEAGGDSAASLKFKRVDGPIEAQFEVETSFNGVGKKDIQEKYNSTNTYVKYNIKDDLYLTAYPYNMGTTVGSWFGDSDHASEIGGVVVSKGNLNVGLGFDQAQDTTYKKEVVTALKADYSFNLAGIYLKTQYSGVFFDEDNLNPLRGANAYPDNKMIVKEKNRLGLITQQADIFAYKKVGDKLALMGELAYNKLVENSLKLGDEFVDSGAAGMFRAEYSATNKLKPYAQVKYITDGFLNYWREKEFNAEGKTSGKDKFTKVNTTVNGKTVVSIDGVKTGGTTEFIVGTEYKLQNNLVATLEGQYVKAGEKVFYTWGADKKHAEKTYYELTTGLAYYF